ncbi:MAG: ABC transporter permease [Saprospiraceae bacterium]|nr:ABC transporter permease [Saprospiraceae bacterium]
MLNFTGLYVGLTISLLIGLLLLHERSFDNFHRDTGNIYRVVCELTHMTGKENLPLAQGPVAGALRDDVGGIQDIANVYWLDETVVQLSGDYIFQEKNVIYADSAFFDLFNFKTDAGQPAWLLRQPNKVILTKSTAARYFPGGNAVGKTFRLGSGEERKELEVAGLMPDPPANSHLQFSMLVSWPSLSSSENDQTNWGFFNGGRYVYLRLPPGTSAASVGEQLATIANARKDKQDESSFRYALQPLANIHSEMVHAEMNPSYTVDFERFYWLGAIGLFLLLVACVNYVNLSTAIASQRAKETGVRKTLGADRWQLAFGFLGQTFVLSATATALAAFTAAMLLSPLNVFLERQIVAQWWSPQVLGLLAALCLLTTLLAGFYPALVLAGFNPSEVLRGTFNMRHSRISLFLRRGLVTFQFVVAQIFITAVIVAAMQMKYLRDKPLGFRQDGIVDIRLPEANSERINALKNEIAQIPGVRHVSQGAGAPTAKWGQLGTIYNLRENYDRSKIEVAVKICDANYKETYGIEMLAGRFINSSDEVQCAESIPEQERRYVCVINESGANALGFATPEAALGKEIMIGINRVTPAIVGVVRDFHTHSLRETVGSTVLMPFHMFKNNLGISLEPAVANAATLSSIEKIWKKIYPETLFESAFLDEHLASLYRAESRTFTLFQLVTLLALMLNALGLIGLTAFIVEQKTKEIGVRKVLGASVVSVVTLLSREFLQLVVVAFVIAFPVAYYFMGKWLGDFAYRIEIESWMFLLAGAGAILIALLTVSFQSLKAALANPVKSLRSE